MSVLVAVEVQRAVHLHRCRLGIKLTNLDNPQLPNYIDSQWTSELELPYPDLFYPLVIVLICTHT